MSPGNISPQQYNKHLGSLSQGTQIVKTNSGGSHTHTHTTKSSGGATSGGVTEAQSQSSFSSSGTTSSGAGTEGLTRKQQREQLLQRLHSLKKETAAAARSPQQAALSSTSPKARSGSSGRSQGPGRNRTASSYRDNEEEYASTDGSESEGNSEGEEEEEEEEETEGYYSQHYRGQDTHASPPFQGRSPSRRRDNRFHIEDLTNQPANDGPTSRRPAKQSITGGGAKKKGRGSLPPPPPPAAPPKRGSAYEAVLRKNREKKNKAAQDADRPGSPTHSEVTSSSRMRNMYHDLKYGLRGAPRSETKKLVPEPFIEAASSNVSLASSRREKRHYTPEKAVNSRDHVKLQ